MWEISLPSTSWLTDRPCYLSADSDITLARNPCSDPFNSQDLASIFFRNQTWKSISVSGSSPASALITGAAISSTQNGASTVLRRASRQVHWEVSPRGGWRPGTLNTTGQQWAPMGTMMNPVFKDLALSPHCPYQKCTQQKHVKRIQPVSTTQKKWVREWIHHQHHPSWSGATSSHHGRQCRSQCIPARSKIRDPSAPGDSPQNLAPSTDWTRSPPSTPGSMPIRRHLQISGHKNVNRYNQVQNKGQRCRTSHGISSKTCNTTFAL